MGVTGDFDKLRRLRDNLRQCASPAMKAEVSQVLAASAMKLVADEFRKSTNPYGAPWAPLAHKRSRGGKSSSKPLLDTGRMRNSVSTTPLANGFRVAIPVVYAPVHQDGATIAARSNAHGQTLWHNPSTGRLVGKNTRLKAVVETKAKAATFGEVVIPRRQMLPTAATGGLGSIWLDTFNKDVADLLRRRLAA